MTKIRRVGLTGILLLGAKQALFDKETLAIVMTKCFRAVAASIARLVIYIEILHATETTRNAHSSYFVILLNK